MFLSLSLVGMPSLRFFSGRKQAAVRWPDKRILVRALRCLYLFTWERSIVTCNGVFPVENFIALLQLAKREFLNLMEDVRC